MIGSHADKAQHTRSVTQHSDKVDSGLRLVAAPPNRRYAATGESGVNGSSQVIQQHGYQAMADSRSDGLQSRSAVPLLTDPAASIQLKSDIRQGSRQVNHTGLPDNLKSGVESLSGISMDDVKVHYNSDKPAQLNAHAYAQGSEIHLGSGQEKHLPHEAWHVIQQKKGRVRPTLQMKGSINVNDEPSLEQEADDMGQQALQRGAIDTGPVATIPSDSGMVQMVNKEIGKITRIGGHPGGILDKMKVMDEIGSGNTFTWPTDTVNTYFNSQHYSGSVEKAMNWGAGGGEGTAGWYSRQYDPQDFHNIAIDASVAIRGINTPALDQEPNKALIAIRAFRGAAGSGMGRQTLTDLRAIETALTAARPALAASNLIANATDNVMEIKADPAEAHPNTLPTAKVTFPGGRTLYFKGRDGNVENALVGTAGSAATTISALGAATAGSEVGSHTFVMDGGRHMSGDVGPPAPPGHIGPEEVKRGWVSAARTAAIVSLTGTGDLHGSNVIDGATATKHIIDAEFLLDATAWDNYEQASQVNEIPNFNIRSMVPAWLLTHTHGLGTMEKLALGDEVALRFQAMNLNTDGALEAILAPIRTLIEHETLLRISPEPFITSFWLTSISQFHEAADKDQEIEEIWNLMLQVYPDEFHIDLLNKRNAIARLKANFNNGMVPLFHLGSYSGMFYLNKDTLIGQIRPDRSTDRFLDLTKTAMLNGYANMVLKIRAAIVEA